ncbi:MAG: hypothetical protein KA160_09010 [Lacibacter sp.]|nr:hypothetical protein [Lacibacter sp.]
MLGRIIESHIFELMQTSIFLTVFWLLSINSLRAQVDSNLKKIDKIVSSIEKSSTALNKYVAYDSTRKLSPQIEVAWPSVLEYYRDRKSNQIVKLVATSKAGSENPYKNIFYFNNKRIIKIVVFEQRSKNVHFPNGVDIKSVLYYEGGKLIHQEDEKQLFKQQQLIHSAGLHYSGYPNQ